MLLQKILLVDKYHCLLCDVNIVAKKSSKTGRETCSWFQRKQWKEVQSLLVPHLKKDFETKTMNLPKFSEEINVIKGTFLEVTYNIRTSRTEAAIILCPNKNRQLWEQAWREGSDDKGKIHNFGGLFVRKKLLKWVLYVCVKYIGEEEYLTHPDKETLSVQEIKSNYFKSLSSPHPSTPEEKSSIRRIVHGIRRKNKLSKEKEDRNTLPLKIDKENGADPPLQEVSSGHFLRSHEASSIELAGTQVSPCHHTRMVISPSKQTSLEVTPKRSRIAAALELLGYGHEEEEKAEETDAKRYDKEKRLSFDSNSEEDDSPFLDKDKLKDKELVKKDLKQIENLKQLKKPHLYYLFHEKLPHLMDIFEGKVFCRRDSDFMKGGKANVSLTYQLYALLFSEKQIDFLMEQLVDVFCNTHAQDIDYVLKVMLPELLIAIYMELAGTDHDESDELMAKDIFKKKKSMKICNV